MNYAVAKKRFQPHALSPGVTTGSQVFHTCCWLFLIAFFILPDGFGFHLFIDWSAKRLMAVVCYAQILFNRKRLTEFWNILKTLIVPNIYIFLHLFIIFYTEVYRRNFGSIPSILFNDSILYFYFFCYLFLNQSDPLSTSKLISFLRTVLLLLCLEGLWEAATGINLFGFLNFVGADGWGTYTVRGGILSRVMGNCHHSITFGIYLSILFFISCVDVQKNKLFLFRSPLLFILTSVCIFLTGSRAPLGIYIFCVFLICLFSKRDERIKSIIILLSVVSVFTLFTMIVYRTQVGRQIMLMFTNIWDVIFDTRYADQWGGTAIHSTEYREALAKVFELDYFNRFLGRGASYGLSVVIDGYWLRSCDNSYVMTYIQYAYPGLIMMILHGVIMLIYSLKGLFKDKNYLFAATFVVDLCYYINIWYVASMGIGMYIWMLFALIFVCNKNKQILNPKKEVLQ